MNVMRRRTRLLHFINVFTVLFAGKFGFSCLKSSIFHKKTMIIFAKQPKKYFALAKQSQKVYSSYNGGIIAVCVCPDATFVAGI